MAGQDDPIEQLDEDIRRARDAAEDANILEDPDEPKFYESGARGDSKELDDQQIAPPG